MLAVVILFTVVEPRSGGKALLPSLLSRKEPEHSPPSAPADQAPKDKRALFQERAAARRQAVAAAAASSNGLAAGDQTGEEASTSGQDDSMWGSVRELLSSRSFQVASSLHAVQRPDSRSMARWQHWVEIFDQPADACGHSSLDDVQISCVAQGRFVAGRVRGAAMYTLYAAV